MMPGLAYDAVMAKAAVGIDVLVAPVYTFRCADCGIWLGAERYWSAGQVICRACS